MADLQSTEAGRDLCRDISTSPTLRNIMSVNASSVRNPLARCLTIITMRFRSVPISRPTLLPKTKTKVPHMELIRPRLRLRKRGRPFHLAVACPQARGEGRSDGEAKGANRSPWSVFSTLCSRQKRTLARYWEPWFRSFWALLRECMC